MDPSLRGRRASFLSFDGGTTGRILCQRGWCSPVCAREQRGGGGIDQEDRKAAGYFQSASADCA